MTIQGGSSSRKSTSLTSSSSLARRKAVTAENGGGGGGDFSIHRKSLSASRSMYAIMYLMFLKNQNVSVFSSFKLILKSLLEMLANLFLIALLLLNGVGAF